MTQRARPETGSVEMTSLESLEWHRAFGQLAENVDRAGFWLALVRRLTREVHFDTWVALVFDRQQPPRILAESDEDDGADDALFQDYQRGLYLLDPFYIDACERDRCGLFTLAEVAPQHFTRTEYYQRYFQRNIVADEIHFNQTLDDRRILCLSLGSTRPFSREALGSLALMQPWLLALMRLRMHFEPEEDGASGPHPWHPQPDKELDFDSRYALTEREREVSQLMLGGSSTKEIARRLAISIETVRAHKKHLYAKLGVSSQSELFSLFWQARR
ncbi:helix-turn-helix transcriptional regulator [Salinicola sp. LHM]|uniref:response regulator transcription factor n=1 Tax=Salinicola sp. LHM TaxID=3065298 RepID=UPI002ACED90A|nr:helix-turn-helix transcriptional regulator [Salinicola sp. LHM]WQH32950.1 helix-turn-helix transcriptional regulator [Salinicola sp. LHM]